MRQKVPIWFTIFFGISIAVHPTTLFGQACQGVAGTWYDLYGTPDYGYAWSLSQSDNTISGTVSNMGCGGTWNVTGSIQTNGEFSLTASGSGCPASWFTYTGSNNNSSYVGCNYGSGTWTNSLSQSDSWEWSKACDAPSGESTSYGGGSWDGTIRYWAATALSTSGLLFGGRTVTEAPYQGGADSCHFVGSDYESMASGSYMLGNEAVVDWSQGYTDRVGWITDAVTFYRNAEVVPCGFTGYQQMKIYCSYFSTINFKQNILVSIIWDDTEVESCRDGKCESTFWP